jgi:hypothetical protein
MLATFWREVTGTASPHRRVIIAQAECHCSIKKLSGELRVVDSLPREGPFDGHLLLTLARIAVVPNLLGV